MDYLDPRKRRSHRIRLMIGYFLMCTAVGLGTVILVYAAYGYGINTKTGQVVENGLVFVDSQPGGSSIYLNGEYKNTTTPARLILPTGNYSLSLQKTGYRSWSRSFNLQERTIARFVYPFLFPTKPQVTNLKTYTTQPGLIIQSPDRKWLLVQNPDATSSTVSFDEYDTTALTKAAQTPVALDMPANLLSSDQANASLSLVEWSTDNNHVLLKNTFDGGSEYIVFDRNNPTDSFNVNKLFSITPDQVALFNKKVDQLYIYNQSDQTLQLGDTAKATLAAPILKGVLAFKPYGTDLLTYVTAANQPTGQVQARIWNKGPTYPLYSFKAGSQYLIDAAQYQGQWYYFAGSDTEARINVYKNPLDNIKNPAIGKAIPVLALSDLGATHGSFSTTARFIEVEAGQNFVVFDLETLDTYQYTLGAPLSGPMTWMDGNRLIGQSDGNSFVMDYDNTNAQSLTPTIETDGGLFSKDYHHLLDAQAVDGSSSVNLANIDLRAGVDLPKQ